MTIAPNLAKLVELQRLSDAQKQLRELQHQYQALQAKDRESLDFFDQMLANQKAKIDDTQKFFDEKHVELEKTEEDMHRTRSKLNAVSSQRELTALNKEIESNRKAASLRSEELRKLEEELQAARADFDKRSAERAELAKEMEALEAGLQAKIEEHQSQTQDREEQLKAIRAGLDRELLARFDRIAKAREGQAVADVNPNGTCAACNIALPPQVFNLIQSGEKIEYCSNCQRMLISFARIDHAGEES